MSGRVALVYSPDLVRYDHGPQHPLKPARVMLTRELIAAYGMLDDDRVEEVPTRVATDEDLMLVHTERYLDAVKRAGEGEPGDWWRYGFGPGDNPIFPNMHEASARVAGASLVAADAVLSGGVEHAFSPAGGLHHAMPERASGFCVYDDPALAIAWMLVNGAERIAYVDVDVHHGDGPQAIFYEDPRVLTISIHESGRYLFPGTGFPNERGTGQAEGTKVNVPLPPNTSDQGWLLAFREVVPPLVRDWRPDVLVTQLGCDTHHSDPLAHLALSTRAYREVATILHGLAHEAAGGRWLATGGGGYQWARVVPRAWTIYFAEMAEREPPDDIPLEWLELAARESGAAVPDRLSEEPPKAVEDLEAIGEVVEEARRAVTRP
jgi:acetoin utilization protein AcuC